MTPDGTDTSTDRPAPPTQFEIETETYRLGMLSEFKRQLPDADPGETQEWIEALDGVYTTHGRERADFLLRKVLKRAPAAHRPAGTGAVALHQHHLARAGAAVPGR